MKQLSGEFYISRVIKFMIQSGIKFSSIELDNQFVFNLGTPEQLRHYINNTKVCLFDLDGTLILSDDIYYDVWNDILKEHNITLTKELYERYIYGNNDTVVRDKLHLPDISAQKDELFKQHIDKIRLVEGSLEFVQTLKRYGHRVGVVTNSNAGIADIVLKYTGLDKHIDHLVIGNDCNKPKPAPDPYLKAIKHFSVLKEHVIVFEDSKTGLLSACGASPGIVVGIETLYESDELIKCGANITIKNYMGKSLDSFKVSPHHTLTQKITRYITNMLSPNSVHIHNHKIKGGFIADIFSAKINNEDYVIKMESTNSTSILDIAKQLSLCEREYYFYQHFASEVPVNVPKCLAVLRNERSENVGIILEDISRFRLNLNLNEEDISVSLKVVDSIAKLHAHFWNKDLVNVQPNSNYNWKQFLTNKWEIFQQKWEVDDDMKSFCNNIVRDFEKIRQELSQGDLTLCHGDVKSPNIFYDDDNNPWFIDWQYIIKGKGVQDLVFFMIESFDSDTLAKHFDTFVDYYYDKLMLYNASIVYKKRQYYQDIINAGRFFPFFVAMWFGTINTDELIDKNFPYFYIKRLFAFYNLPIFNKKKITYESSPTFHIENVPFHSVDNVVSYTFDNFEEFVLQQPHKPEVGEKTVYFCPELVFHDAFAHWVLESAIFFTLFRNLQELYPNIRLYLNSDRKFKRLFCNKFGLQHLVDYELKLPNMCILPSPFASSHNIKREFPDYTKQLIMNFTECFNTSHPKDISQILLPRQFAENFPSNDRYINTDMFILKSTMILNTDNVDNIDMQFEMVNRSKTVILTDGSPYLVNGIFCRNSEIILVQKSVNNECVIAQARIYPRYMFLHEYIKSMNRVNIFNSEV